MSQVRALLGAPSATATGARAAHRHPGDFAKEDRGERIRTSDLLRPRQARYQAALRPARSDGGVYSIPVTRASGGPQGHGPRTAASSTGWSATTARPRWLRRFFSVEGSSARVSPGVSAGRNRGSYPNPFVPRGAKAMAP